MKGKAGGRGAVSSAMGSGGRCWGSDGVDRGANGLGTSEENRNMPIQMLRSDVESLGEASTSTSHLAAGSTVIMPRCYLRY